MRLLLFDIDGTLTWGGPAKIAFEAALADVYGTAGPIGGHDFSGKTDPQIARELMQRAGLDEVTIDAGLPRLWEGYLARMEQLLPERPVRVLPGVSDLMRRLSERSEVALALVTGNIQRGAMLKLRSGGLEGHFSVGGFGSDSEVRNLLPPIALQRATDTWGVGFLPDETIVIGDTPRDVECGRYSLDRLAESKPDHVLPDLADTDHVLNLLLG